MKNRYLALAIIYIVLGIALFAAGQITDLGNSTLAQIVPGMGGALICVGAIRLYRGIRLEKDRDYRENFEVETHDERNQWLRMNSRSRNHCFRSNGQERDDVICIRMCMLCDSCLLDLLCHRPQEILTGGRNNA